MNGKVEQDNEQELRKAIEERLSPLRDNAHTASRHFVAQIAMLVLAMRKNMSQKNFDIAADELLVAFAKAFSESFMMMLGELIEEGILSDTILNVQGGDDANKNNK